MHRGTVVKQRQEHDDALDDRRSGPSVESTPPVQIPPLHGFELMPPCRPPGTPRLPDLIYHSARVQERLKTRLVRVRHVVRILGEPVCPGLLDAVLTKIAQPDDEDVR